jgi:hypothetical protein
MREFKIAAILFSLLFVFTCSDQIMREEKFEPPRVLQQENSLKFVGYDVDLGESKFLGYDASGNTKSFKESILAKLISTSASAEGTPNEQGANGNRGNGRLLRTWQTDDDAKNFFKTDPFETDITKLPAQGKSKKTPWSGYYWAIRYGVGSLRYSDDLSINTMYKIVNGTKYTRTYSESVGFYSQPQDYNAQVANGADLTAYVAKYMSATEKYDLAVGDTAFTLTNYYKNLGNSVKKGTDGDVASWMGICHGWSVASYSEPKPLTSVDVIAADGITRIRFRPNDIMAIASMYWANAKFTSNFVGYMCDISDTKNIPRDVNTGITTEYACWGFNPGSFHIILSNHMGKNGNSFVFDPDNTDYQIWNFPVSDYKVDYYQVTTKLIKPIDTAVVSIADAKTYLQTNKDTFLSFVVSKIDPTTAYIVGVRVAFKYAVEKMPDTQETATGDLYTNSNIFYYLELDKDKKIKGGEWRSLQHPNFAWGPYRSNDEYLMAEDKVISNFTGTSGELVNMTVYANAASARGSPLRAFMKYLTSQAVLV